MALRFLVLSFRFVPLILTYPLMACTEKTYDLWWRFALWHVQASGPTLIKLGQWASTRRDVFSKEFCDRLSILHTKTKKKRLFRDCDKVLVSLFGPQILKNKARIFPNIEPYSIGSGCIAQVFRLTMDLEEYERIYGVRVPGLEGMTKVEMAVKVFPVVVAYNKKAIMETFEEGMYINRLVAEEEDPELKTKQAPAVRRKIAMLGARALLKMVFVDNFVHGDLHPGNILVRFNDKEASGVHFAPPSASRLARIKDFLRDTFRIRAAPRLNFSDSPDLNDEPTLILLDTGIAISETPKNLRNLRRIFRCIVEKRGYKAGELMLEDSPYQNCKDPDRFCTEVDKLVAKARSERSLRTLNISALMSQLFSIVSEHHVQLDSAFTSILLSIMVLEGFGRSLDPDLDLFQCARPYLLNVML
ncbi:unnamed protein product, partial [Mesorhabditis spiculigera]